MATNYNAPTTSSASLELSGTENLQSSVLEITQAKKRGRRPGSKNKKGTIASFNTIKYIKFILSYQI